MTHLLNILPNHSWLAIADINELSNIANHSLTGSEACRLLLIQLQHHVNIAGNLCDNQFPYQLIQESLSTYFVSFSHSSRQVAVLLSKSAKLGVDIENKIIRQTVAERFFSHDELTWLQTIEHKQQATAMKLLWTLKESHVKQQSSSHSRLLTSLKFNLLSIFSQDDLNRLFIKHHQLNILQKNHQVLAFYPEYCCGLWLAI